MIGGLVEQEKRRLRDKGAGKQDAAAPTAGQSVHDSFRREAQPRQNEFYPLLEPPSVPLFEFVLQIAEFFEEEWRGDALQPQPPCGDRRLRGC